MYMETKDFEWDYAPFPYFKGGKPVTSTGSWHLGLNAYSNKKDEAAKFMKFLTTPPGCIEWFLVDGHLSPNKVVLDYIKKDPKFQTFPYDRFHLSIYESLNTAIPRPVTPGYLEYEQLLTDAFENIRNGADVKQTLTVTATRIDQMLRKYR